MKKIFLILSLFVSLSLDAQFVTTLAKNVPETQEDGVFYYLPRNVIRLEFLVEESDYHIGPYAEFASKLMGINDYIKENKKEYNIKSVDIQLVNEVDPNAAYFISFDEKSKEPLLNVILDNDGLILSIGYEHEPAKPRILRTSFLDNGLNLNENKEISFVEILDNEIERGEDDEEEGNVPKKITKEDKAKYALEKIKRARSAYMDIVTGDQEVSAGSSLPFMVENLKSIENEYVSLFKGKVAKSTYSKVFYITPEENQANASVSIAKLSNTDGMVESGGKGEVIKIQFESKNTLANIKQLSDETKKASLANKIFYRMPEESNVKVLVGNNVLAEKQLTISQFGVIRTMSVKNNKILFDPNTGQIISVIR